LALVSMKELLEAGVHFGHKTRRWNPKMKKFIFAERNGIYIINLQKTLAKLKEAYIAVRENMMQGGSILFVGTKRQAKDAVREEGDRCGAFYVSERWLGGMLTNFRTIRRTVDRMRQIEKMRNNGAFKLLPKKEVLRLEREYGKYEKVLSGIKDMEELPSMVYVIDAHKERIVVNEARRLKIPIVGIVDTNIDPDPIDYPVPGNDDAIRSIKLITSLMANAVLEGKELVAKASVETTASEDVRQEGEQ
jgi:small subunit ribosomal protein S2